jgi:hypothetical protein
VKLSCTVQQILIEVSSIQETEIEREGYERERMKERWIERDMD